MGTAEEVQETAEDVGKEGRENLGRAKQRADGALGGAQESAKVGGCGCGGHRTVFS